MNEATLQHMTDDMKRQDYQRQWMGYQVRGQMNAYPPTPTTPEPQQADNPKQEGSAHYTQMNIQPWDVIDTWPIEQQVGYHRGNVLKYTMRMGNKDDRLQEAKKIRHYADKLIEVLERTNGSNPGSEGKG